MAFHEAFWILTGTAAPVIALAAVVSAGSADQAWQDLREPYERYRDAAPEAALKWLSSNAALQWRGVILAGVSKAQYVNVVLQAGLLALSLASVGSQRNAVPLAVAGALAVVGIMLIALAGSRNVVAVRDLNDMRGIARQAEEESKAGDLIVSAGLGAAPPIVGGQIDGGAESDQRQ
jgi:hypothetical protein